MGDNTRVLVIEYSVADLIREYVNGKASLLVNKISDSYCVDKFSVSEKDRWLATIWTEVSGLVHSPPLKSDRRILKPSFQESRECTLVRLPSRIRFNQSSRCAEEFYKYIYTLQEPRR